jgi:hypothetical protein
MAQAEGPRLDGRNGEIWRAYLFGKTQEAIAEEFGIHQTRVSQIIRDVRESLPETDANELRRADLERLDAMLPNNILMAIAGDKDAVNSVLKIMERRAKLLGLDAPTKQEVQGGLMYKVIGLDPGDPK